MARKQDDLVTQKQIDEAINYSYAIRSGILWITEAIIFSKEFVRWKIPITAVDEAKQEIDWAKFEKNHPKEYRQYIALELFSGINNDFLHFTNYSLKSLHPATMAVSYSLARKPYKDSLLHLEYLYARQDEYMDMFLSDTKSIDNHIKNETLRKSLVKEACEKLRKKNPLSLATSELSAVYDFRYKTEFAGFYDKSSHLITSKKNNYTENVNMNFIFLNNSSGDAEFHAAHLLRMHLISLGYALELMYELFYRLAEDFFSKEDFRKLNEHLEYVFFKKMVSNIAMMYGHRLLSGGTLDKSYIIQLMSILKPALKFECPACGSKSFADKTLKAAEYLVFDEVLLCKKCKYPCSIEHPVRLSIEY